MNVEVHTNDGTTTTAYYLVKFTGTQVAIRGAKGPDRGVASYSICDANGANCGTAENVDGYAGSLSSNVWWWTSPPLSQGTYTGKVATTNTKNASSTGKYVDLDRVGLPHRRRPLLALR